MGTRDVIKNRIHQMVVFHGVTSERWARTYNNEHSKKIIEMYQDMSSLTSNELVDLFEAVVVMFNRWM